MRIVVDERKRLANLAKHGLDFDDTTMFDWNGSSVVPARDGRLKAIGRLCDKLVTIIFRRLGTEGLSIISTRSASRRERQAHGAR